MGGDISIISAMVLASPPRSAAAMATNNGAPHLSAQQVLNRGLNDNDACEKIINGSSMILGDIKPSTFSSFYLNFIGRDNRQKDKVVVRLVMTSRTWVEEIWAGGGLVVLGPSIFEGSGRGGGCKLWRGGREVHDRRLRAAWLLVESPKNGSLGKISWKEPIRSYG